MTTLKTEVHRPIDREIAVFRNGGALSFRQGPGAALLLDVVPPGRTVECTDDLSLAAIIGTGTRHSDPAVAVAAGDLRIYEGIAPEGAETLLRLAVCREVHSRIMFPLIWCGKSPGQWRLEPSSDALRLRDYEGRELASLRMSNWWHLEDEGRSDWMAKQLVAASRLERVLEQELLALLRRDST